MNDSDEPDHACERCKVPSHDLKATVTADDDLMLCLDCRDAEQLRWEE